MDGVTGRVNGVGDTTIVSAKAVPHTISGPTDGLQTFQCLLVADQQGNLRMSKFYVQSGSIHGIVDCYDSECAAVWVVNRVMNSIEPTQNAIEYDEDNDADIGMFALDDKIRISEQGFDRDDCEVVDTHMAFLQWHQLKRAIEALHQQMNDRIDDDL